METTKRSTLACDPAVELGWAAELQCRVRRFAALLAEIEGALSAESAPSASGAPHGFAPDSGSAGAPLVIATLRRLRAGVLPRCTSRPELERRLEQHWTALLEAQRRLIERYLPLVEQLARGLRRLVLRSTLLVDDLAQEGAIGLMHASERYDPARGVRFPAFASYAIRAAMIRAAQNQSRTVRLPVHIQEQLRRWESVRASLPAATAAAEAREAICERLRLDDVRASALDCFREATLECELLDGGSEDWAALPRLAAPRAPTALELLADRELRALARAALARLSAREQSVIHWRCGLSDDEPLTLSAIGSRLGVSAERARQIEKRAVSKLREAVGEPRA